MTGIIATVRHGNGWLTSDGFWELLPGPLVSLRRPLALWHARRMLGEIIAADNGFYARKIHVVTGAKMAVCIAGTMAARTAVMHWASRCAGIGELADTLPGIYAALPRFLRRYHVIAVGWDEKARNARGVCTSIATGAAVEEIAHSMYTPDIDAFGPHYFNIDRWLKGKMMDPDHAAMHRKVGENWAWQSQQGRFKARRIGGHLTTAIVTRDGVEMVDAGDLDALAAA